MKLPFFGGRHGVYVPSGNPYAGQVVAVFANGTFSRSSDGTYLTDAEAISVATSNVLRSENRGDGYGAIPLFEGARTNLCQYTNNIASWVTIANNLGYDAAGTSPLGTTTAGRILKNLGSNTAPAVAINIGGTKAGTLSLWAKDNGSSQPACRLRFSASTGIAIPYTPGATWVRYDAYDTFTGLANDFISFDTRANTPNAGNPALGATIDHLVWGVQLEAVVTFPSSVIINNTGSSATRSADTLTLSTAQYTAAAIQSFPTRWAVYPYFASSDLADGDSFTIASFGDANSQLRIRKASGSVKAEVVSGGSVVAASDALTFSRHQQLLITTRPAEGKIVTAGATTGDGTGVGTAWTFANSTMRVGGILSSTGEAFCRIAQPVGVL